MNDALASFRCDLDKDIETFLHEKALNFIERGWCSVYLIVDEAEFDNGHINDDGQKRVETIFAQYGMGFNESMEMVLNAICTYTKWLNKTLLKGVPMA